MTTTDDGSCRRQTDYLPRLCPKCRQSSAVQSPGLPKNRSYRTPYLLRFSGPPRAGISESVFVWLRDGDHRFAVVTCADGRCGWGHRKYRSWGYGAESSWVPCFCRAAGCEDSESPAIPAKATEAVCFALPSCVSSSSPLRANDLPHEEQGRVRKPHAERSNASTDRVRNAHEVPIGPCSSCGKV